MRRARTASSSPIASLPAQWRRPSGENEKGGKKKKEKKEKKKDPFGRLFKHQNPGDGRLMFVGVICSLVAGAVQGSLGVLMLKVSFVMQLSDPYWLFYEGFKWSIVFTLCGLINHACQFVGLATFGLAGEHLTHNLRLSAMTKLMHHEVGYFDDERNSIGELTEFLGEKLGLVQA